MVTSFRCGPLFSINLLCILIHDTLGANASGIFSPRFGRMLRWRAKHQGQEKNTTPWHLACQRAILVDLAEKIPLAPRVDVQAV